MAAPIFVMGKRKWTVLIVLGVLLLLCKHCDCDEKETGDNDVTNSLSDDLKNGGDVLLETVIPSQTDYIKNSDQSQEIGVKKDGASSQDAQDEKMSTKSADRELFSLTSLVKSFLNPAIDDFNVQNEVESDKIEEIKESVDSQSGEDVPEVNGTLIDSVMGNSSLNDNSTNKNDSDTSKKYKFQCSGRNSTENITLEVQLVNSTTLLEVLSFDKNRTSADCVIVMFYAPWCQFCAQTAPHYNALARAFPQLEVLAVDAVHFSNLNARFGTVAVPNVMLFHQSRSAVRFNHTERVFQSFVQFIKNVTGLEANVSVNLTEEDYIGPLSSTPTEDSDYLLWVSWVFVVACSTYMFVISRYGQQAINTVTFLWQEHQHIE